MKVLFLDFGYIMYPCIKKYSEYLKKEINKSSVSFWEEINKASNLIDELDYDAILYKKICIFLLNQKKKNIPFCITDTHMEVASIYQDMNTPIEATVIDFYNGFASDGNDVDLITLQNKIKESIWLSYLVLKNIVVSVDWYKTPQSESIKQEFNSIANKTSEKYLSDIDKALSQEYDSICLTCSPYVFPYKFKHLYDVLVWALLG